MRVWPKNEAMKKLLKHPVRGGFKESGPTEWPRDAYTLRRLRDGDIVKDEPKAARTERKSTSTYDAGKTASKGE